MSDQSFTLQLEIPPQIAQQDVWALEKQLKQVAGVTTDLQEPRDSVAATSLFIHMVGPYFGKAAVVAGGIKAIYDLAQILYNFLHPTKKKSNHQQGNSNVVIMQKGIRIELYNLSSEEIEARLLNQMGSYHYDRAHYQEAEQFLQRALAMFEQQLGPNHPDILQSLYSLAQLYQMQYKYEQTELLLRRALAICEKQFGPQHPNTAQSLNNLGSLCLAQGRYELQRPSILGSTADFARRLHDQKGKYKQAKALFQRALAIREKQLGPQHPDTAVSLGDLAGVYFEQGQYAQAEPLHQRALAILEQQLDPQHIRIATALNNLAVVYQMQGKDAQAEPLHQRALAIREQHLSPRHPWIIQSLNSLATLYQKQGKYAQAESLRKRALALAEQRQELEPPPDSGRREADFRDRRK